MKALNKGLKERIIRAVERISQKWIDEAIGKQDMLLLHIQDNENQLDKIISDWIKQDGPAITILTGPLGSGKTIASCQLPAQLNKGDKINGVVLWLPLRDTDLYETDPNRSIKRLIGLKKLDDLWGEESNLKLIILDGVDEAFSLHGADKMILWLGILFKRAHACCSKPRIMLCGRDVFMEKRVINSQLFDKITAFCRTQSINPTEEPMSLRIKPWDDDYHRRIMKERLREKFGPVLAESMTDRIGPQVLTSPLLFGIAYSIFDEIAEKRKVYQENNFPFFKNEWELTSYWVDFVIGRETLNRNTKANSQIRRSATQEIALFLALKDRNISGVSLEDILNLDKCGLKSVNPNLFDDFKADCLLSVRKGGYSIFHDAILIHLAAEALDRLFYENREYESDVTVLRSQICEQLAKNKDMQGLLSIIMLIKKLIDLSALQPDSIFFEVVNYWVRYKWNTNQLAFFQIPIFDLNSTHHYMEEESQEPFDMTIEILVLFRNAALRCLPKNSPEIAPLWKNSKNLLINDSDRNNLVSTIIVNGNIPNTDQLFVLIKQISSNNEILGTVERGINDGLLKKFFLPLATRAKTEELARQLSDELSKSGITSSASIQVVMDNFLDYFLEQVYVDMQNGQRIVISDLHSKTKSGDILEAVLGEIKSAGLLENKQENYHRLILKKKDFDGTLVCMDNDDSLEQFRVLSFDTLIVDQTFQLSIFQEIPGEVSPGITSLQPEKYLDKKILALEMPGLIEMNSNFISLPLGRFPLWKQVEKGYRRIYSSVIRHNVFISENLVTVSEYAIFLRETPNMPLPSQPEAGWRYEDSQIIYDPSSENLPVTGVSREEALAYLKWLEQKNKNVTTSLWWYRLPRPEWLQIASIGPQMEELSYNGNGPFGHKNLTGTVWQWTDGDDDNSALAFGGSPDLGNEVKGSVQKTLSRGFPDLCQRLLPEARNSQVGIRVCIVDLKNTSER